MRRSILNNFTCSDVMREARSTLVMAAQFSTSFIPDVGPDKTRVLTLNLRNRIIFKAADGAGPVERADFLGQRKVIKRSWGFSDYRCDGSRLFGMTLPSTL